MQQFQGANSKCVLVCYSFRFRVQGSIKYVCRFAISGLCSWGLILQSWVKVFRGDIKLPCAIKRMKGHMQQKEIIEFVREGEMMRKV